MNTTLSSTLYELADAAGNSVVSPAQVMKAAEMAENMERLVFEMFGYLESEGIGEFYTTLDDETVSIFRDFFDITGDFSESWDTEEEEELDSEY